MTVAGHIVHVQTIQLTAGRTPTELGLTFTLTSDSGVSGVFVNDANPAVTNINGGGWRRGGDNAETVGPMTYG